MALTLEEIRSYIPELRDKPVSDIVAVMEQHGFDTSAIQQEPVEEPGLLKSYVGIPLLKGIEGANQAIGYGLEATGIAPETGRAMQESADERIQTLTSHQSQQAQEDAQKRMIDENGNYGGYNLGTAAQQLFGSAPGIAAMALPGGLLSKSISKVAGPLIGSSVGFSASEGAFSGAQNASQIQQEIRSADFETLLQHPEFKRTLEEDTSPDLSMDDRLMIAKDIVARKAGDQVFAETFMKTGGIALFTGGGMLGALGRGGYTGGLGSRLIKGGLSEFGQEMPQSALERKTLNQAKKDYLDPNQDPNQNVLTEGLEGGLVGFTMGAAGGFKANVEDIAKAPTVDEAIKAASDAVAGGPSPSAIERDKDTSNDIDFAEANRLLAERIKQTQTIPGQPVQQVIDQQYQNSGYKPMGMEAPEFKIRPKWTTPNGEQAQIQAAKNRAFYEAEQAAIQQKQDELAAMEAHPDASPAQVKQYRKKRIELQLQKRKNAELFRQGLGFNIVPAQSGEVRNDQLATQLSRALNEQTKAAATDSGTGEGKRIHPIVNRKRRLESPDDGTVGLPSGLPEQDQRAEGSDLLSASRGVATLDEPWKLTKKEWNKLRESVQPNTAQSKITKGTKSQQVNDFNRLEKLIYGVPNDAQKKIKSAQDGYIKLSKDEIDSLMERINTPVTHRDVIQKALTEGKPVPPGVLKDYPDLQNDTPQANQGSLAPQPAAQDANPPAESNDSDTFKSKLQAADERAKRTKKPVEIIRNKSISERSIDFKMQNGRDTAKDGVKEKHDEVSMHDGVVVPIEKAIKWLAHALDSKEISSFSDYQLGRLQFDGSARDKIAKKLGYGINPAKIGYSGSVSIEQFFQDHPELKGSKTEDVSAEPILTVSKKRYLSDPNAIKSAKDKAYADMERAYDDDLLKAEVSLPFEQYRQRNPDLTENLARQTYDQVREELGLDKPEKLPGDDIFEQLIKIAADDVSKLRKQDVYRVVDDIASVSARTKMGDYIKRHRPDLVAEVDDVLIELDKSEQADAVAKPTAKKKTTVTDRDDLLAAIAKLGGLNRNEAKAQGIDPASFNKRGYGIMRVFTKGGKSYDEMAELLRGYYFDAPTANDLVDQVSRAINQGEKIYTPVGYEIKAELMEQERLSDEEARRVINYQSLLETAKQHDADFGTNYLDILLAKEDMDYDDINAWEEDFYNDRQERIKESLADSETALSSYTEQDIKDREQADRQRIKQEETDRIKSQADKEIDSVFDEMAGTAPKTQDVFGMSDPLEKVSEPEEKPEAAKKSQTQRKGGLTKVQVLAHIAKKYRKLKPLVENGMVVVYDTFEDVPVEIRGDGMASKSMPDKIAINGVERWTVNSNGQPIAQTEEGIRNFWQWFGNSKVVDDQGRPLVVYHGTDKKFNKINFKKSYQPIFWFSSDKEKILSGDAGAKATSVLMELYVKLDSPANRKQYNDLTLSEYKGRGLDGAILEGGNGFVMNQSQIKSATGNTGAFDPNNNDIRYSTHGKSQNPVKIEGFTYKGKIYLIADALSPETIDGVIHHEFFHKVIAENPKIRARLLGAQSDLRGIMRQVEAGRYRGRYKEIYDAAMDRAKKAGTASEQEKLEEFLAYSVSKYLENPQSLPERLARIIKDIIAAIKLAVFKLTGKITDISPADLTAMARSSMRVSEDGGGGYTFKASMDDDIRYSLRDNLETAKDFLTGRDRTVNSLADLDQVLATGKMPQEQLDTQYLLDKAATMLVDSSRPFDIWTRTLPDQIQAGQLILAKDRAKRRTAAIEKEAMDLFIKPLAKVIGQAQKKTKFDYRAVHELMGRWMSARYAIEKNKDYLRKDQDAVNKAEENLKIAKNDPVLKAALTKAKKAQQERIDALNEQRIIDPKSEALQAKLAGGYNNFTAKHYLKAIENLIPEEMLKEAADHVYGLMKWKTGLDLANGKVTQEQVDNWFNSPYYVPLTGDPSVDTSEDELFQHGGVDQARDKEAKGRVKSTAQNGIDAAIEQVQKSARYHGWVDFKDKLTEIYDDLIQTELDDGLNMREAQQAVFDKHQISRSTETPFKSDSSITVRKNGKAFVYDLHNQAAIDALKSINKDEIPSVLQPVAWFTRQYARMVTQFMPGFGLINAIRDTWERSENIRTRTLPGYSNLDMNKVARNAIKTAADPRLIKKLMGIMMSDTVLKDRFRVDETDPDVKMIKEMFAEGGVSTWGDYLAGTNKHLSEQLKDITKGKSKALEVISAWNHAFETVSSYAIYKALRKAGVDKKTAAGGTLDLLNFSKHGTITGPLKALYIFTNPTVQGGHQMIQSLSTRRGKARAAAYLVTGFVLYTMLRALDGDDEELGVNKMDELGNFILERNIPIPLGDGTYLKNPIGFGMPQAMWSTSLNLSKFVFGNQTALDTAAEIGKSFSRTLAPVQPSETSISKHPIIWLMQTFTPQITKPLTNIGLDVNTFGTSLTNSKFRRDDKALALQGRKSTPEFYKDVAAELHKLGIDMYPEQVREIIRGYAVGPLNEIMKAWVENPAKEDLGRRTTSVAIDRYIAKHDTSGLKERLYYRYLDELNSVAAKASLGEKLSQKEQKELALYEQVKTLENKARGKMAAASKAEKKRKGFISPYRKQGEKLRDQAMDKTINYFSEER